MTSLTARVASVAAALPARTAIVDGARRIDYAAFWAQAQAFAHELLSLGVQRGERVAIVLPNRIEAAVACYGAWLAGAIVVPLNAQARTRDFVPWIAHCGARIVVHEQGHRDAELAIAQQTSPVHGIAVDAASPLPTAAQAQDVVALVHPRRDEIAAILYTSGTTGAPKGVSLTHGNLLANAESVVAYLGLRAEDSMLSVLPFYYAYGASVLHTHLISGARLVLEPNLLFPPQIAATMARERVSGFSGVPSTYALLLDRAVLRDHDLSSLRYLTQAGGAMSPALTRRVRAALPAPRLFVMYGQTEATSRISWLPPERLDDKLGSVGLPVAGVEWQVLRDDGTPAPTGEVGELWVRGPNVMRGYWNDAQATSAVLHDGWLRTGDMGHLDDEGFLFLSGRRSDMIKTGAHRVHPGDIEQAIAEIPGVSEVAVVGIDDEVLGQVIKAYVVLSAPLARGEDAIKAHCRAQLAPYKIPREIEFIDALPRTASGKVRRVQLMQPAAHA